MSREAEGLLLGGLAGGLIGGAIGGPAGAAVGLGVGALGGLAIAEAAPGSYRYPGGVWNFSNPQEVQMVNAGLAAFDKCLNDLSAKYAEWKAKFHKAFNEYQSCLVQIDAMLMAWQAKMPCVSPCDMEKMRRLAAEGHMRHKMLKNLMIMGSQVAMMHHKCCVHIAQLQGMINYLDSQCPMPCDLTMYQGDCSKVAIPAPPTMPSPVPPPPSAATPVRADGVGPATAEVNQLYSPTPAPRPPA